MMLHPLCAYANCMYNPSRNQFVPFNVARSLTDPVRQAMSTAISLVKAACKSSFASVSRRCMAISSLHTEVV